MFKITPEFGQVIRGLRHGFYWIPFMEAFVRIDGVDFPTRVDICPNGTITSKRYGSGIHRIFWEGNTEKAIRDLLFLSPVLSNIKRVKKPITLLLDDDGRLVSSD